MRARDLVPGRLGVLAPGRFGAITDVRGVCVGHCTLVQGEDVRTGVTAVLPFRGNVHRERVPAGLSVANGYGKLVGATQVQELGELETPLMLTNTLAVSRAADALVSWTLEQPGNELVTSVNPFAGETNDSVLNDIRQPAVQASHVFAALEAASSGPVLEGPVGAGTGTVAFGYKGGIGSSSRVLPPEFGGHTVGVLVQSNYGGVLSFAGLPAGNQVLEAALRPGGSDGSIMIVIATDAPLSDRNLRRLAARGHAGLARTGSGFSHGSGDCCVAFSVSEEVRRLSGRRVSAGLPDEECSPLFLAAIEATQEAILNSLTMSTDMTGFRGRLVRGLPLDFLS